MFYFDEQPKIKLPVTFSQGKLQGLFISQNDKLKSFDLNENTVKP